MRKFGLIGTRLDYSFSRSFFTDFFEKNAIDASYENIEIEDLISLKTKQEYAGFSGFNVTIPYKTEIFPLLDEISPEATEIGAVNTIQIVNGKWIGHNTDVFGFKQSIKPFLNNKHERAAILGTGGSAKAVAYVLRNIGLEVLFISRNPSGEDQFSYSNLNEYFFRSVKLLVNCTPIGTFPDVHSKPNCPTNFLTPDHLVIDLIYNPAQTQLLAEAEAKGAITLNGYSMLQEQALKSWEIWNLDV